MKLNVILPGGKRTVDFAELKALVRQGVVTPTTLLEASNGKQAQAQKIAELKPLFDELAPRPPQPPAFPPQTAAPPVPPPPPASNVPDFAAVIRGVVQKDAPTPPNAADDLYAISIEDAPTPPNAPAPPQIPASSTAPNSPNGGAYYFEAKNPVPFVPKRFRASKKVFYVDSLKALRSAELSHLTAWGRGFLRVFDTLFIIGVVIYLLFCTINAVKTQYRAAKTLQKIKSAEIFSELNDALPDLGLADPPFSELEETRYAWMLFLTEAQKEEHNVSEYNFDIKNTDAQFKILDIAEKRAVELEKEFPKILTDEEKALQSYCKEFRKDLKQARRLKKEYDSVPFPLFRFLGLTFLALLCASLVVVVAAFLYGLATILIRIFLSAADLYAASFRDDFDPAANKRRDDLLASVETIKTNGAQ